jgi:hypothetical protein
MAVDVAAAQVISQTTGRINWRVCHADCDDRAAATDYRVWVRQFSSTTDLVETLANLADQKRWFAVTNWSGLVRRVLRDTGRHAEIRKNNGRKKIERRLTDPNDSRHGTDSGYTNYGCRCDRCTAAHTEKVRTNRAGKNGHYGVGNTSTESKGNDDE